MALGEFEHLVLLAVVRRDNRAYGMQVMREIERRTGRELAIGAVYRALARLEDKGLLAASKGDPTPQRGGRARKYFELTPSGHEELERVRAEQAAMWEGVSLPAVRTREP